jgi:uncharacterized Zn finger protein (UPF0148 family)
MFVEHGKMMAAPAVLVEEAAQEGETCPRCGSPVEEGDAYCGHCGAWLREDDAPTMA